MTSKVYPGSRQPEFHIRLSDGVRSFGLKLVDGPHAVQEIPMTPSTVHFSGGGTKFGDWEPGMSHIEQRTWEGGRAQADFVDDSTRYSDSKNAWTLTPGKLFPAPAWKFAHGVLSETNQNLPGDLGWRSLYGDYQNIAGGFTHSSAWSGYAKVFLWLRRVGSPGTLTVRLESNSAGHPGVDYGSDTLAASEVNEGELSLHEFSISGAAMIGTNSFIGIYANTSDDAANHWEIGVDIDGGTGLFWDNTVLGWQSGAFSLYYRVTSAPVNRKWHFFELSGALYAVDQKADGSASQLFINGDRGVATSGTSTVLTDSNKAWTADEWVGAWVKIVSGTGAGQCRQISDNTATTLTSAAWEISPDSTSQYVIYHTPTWQDISPSSGDQFAAPAQTVAVLDDQVCFGFGGDAVILKMRWNAAGSPPAHQFDDDGTNYANILITKMDATNGLQIYRFRTMLGSYAFCQRASKAAWGTAYTYGSQVTIGGASEPINGALCHDGELYAFKTDGRYRITTADQAVKTLGQLGFIRSENNGQALLSHGLYAYFSWGGYALQRLYDASGTYDLSNIGPDKDEGLPDGRKGQISALAGSPAGILAAVDGGADNTSSILVMPFSTYGWHEVLRGYQAGKRIQNLHFQDSYRPRLWCDMGGELVYQDWPRHTFNPLKDAGLTYMSEAHLVSSTIDMGVSNLPKFIESLTASLENLASGVEVQLDVQTNQNVGTDSWIYAGTFQVNPFDTVRIYQGEAYRIRFRLRLLTSQESSPPVVNATVLEGFARTPVKYQWNLRIQTSSTQRDLTGRNRGADPDELLAWLKDCARSSRQITMRSVWEQMDSKTVIVEPPTLLRQFTNNILGGWGGQMTITLREV